MLLNLPVDICRISSSLRRESYKLLIALCFSIDNLKLNKYNDNLMKALVRAHCYWLADKNGL